MVNVVARQVQVGETREPCDHGCDDDSRVETDPIVAYGELDQTDTLAESRRDCSDRVAEPVRAQLERRELAHRDERRRDEGP